MEAQIESMIEQFLTRSGTVFTCSQYDIQFDRANGDGGSCPDIVALDFSRDPHEVIVVEITAGANVGPIIEKARNRETRWFAPIRRSLTSHGVIDASWNIRFLCFVREPNVKKARSAFASDADVWFVAIEDAIIPYKYWDSRITYGIPRSPADDRSGVYLPEIDPTTLIL
jgi:hypothetical protein